MLPWVDSLKARVATQGDAPRDARSANGCASVKPMLASGRGPPRTAEAGTSPAPERSPYRGADFDHASRLIGEALADARMALDAAERVEAVAA